MASYKGIGYDTTNGRTRTGSSSDTISFDGLVAVTGDASVGGDLTVTGDIVSRGTVDLLVADNFIDLNAGNNSTAALGGGYTIQMNRNASFGAATVTVFNAGTVGSTAAARTLNTTGVPGGNVTLFTFAYTGTDGTTVTKTITCNSGGGTDTAFTAGITGFNADESKNIERNAATTSTIGAGLRALLGSLLYYTSSGATTSCTITANNNIADLDITIGSRDSNIAESGAATGNGSAAFFTCTGGGTFTSGMIAIITAADDGGNDGIYLVNKKDGNNIFIFGSSGFAIPTGIQFCQTTLTASTETGSECKAYQPDLYIQAVSDGASYNTPATAKGILIDTYDTAAELGDYTGAASWSVVGASAGSDTLQEAYDAGNTITTDASGAITFTLSADNQGFVVDGSGVSTGNVTFGATNTVQTFTVDSGDAISLDAAASSNFSTSVGELTLAGTAADGGITLNAGTGGIDLDITAAGSGTGDGAFTVNAAAASTVDVAGANLTLSTTTSGSLSATSAAALTLTGAAASTWSTTAGDLTVSAASGATDGTIQLNAGTGGVDIDITSAGSGFGNGALTVNAAAASTIDVASADLSLSTTSAGDINITAAATLDIGCVALELDATGGGDINFSGAAGTINATSQDLTMMTTTGGDVTLNSAAGVYTLGAEAFYCIGSFEAGENVVKGNPLYMEAPTAATTGNIAFDGSDITDGETMSLRNAANVLVAFAFTNAASTGTNIGIVNGGLKTVVINAAGTGYSTGTRTISSGGTTGVINITSVGGSGEITGVEITFAGAGYGSATAVAVSGGTSGTVDITALNAGESDIQQAKEAQIIVNAHANFTAPVPSTNNLVVSEATFGNAPVGANATTASGVTMTNFAGGNNTRVKKAQANAISSARIVGFAVSSVTSPNPVMVAGPGSLVGDAGAIGSPQAINIGAALYLSNATAGFVTVTPPTAANSVVYQVGFVTGNASGSTVGYSFQPQFVMENG